MEWSAFKIIQFICWAISLLLLIVALLKPGLLKEKEDIYIGIAASMSAAATALGEFSERRARKFSAANVLAIGYIKNCIEPIMQEQFNQFEKAPHTFRIKEIYVFVPCKIHAINHTAVSASLLQYGFEFEKISVLVSNSNRHQIDIRSVTNKNTGNNYYLDTPNTISSLDALVDYKLGKKENTVASDVKLKLEEKYISIFRSEAESILKELQLNTYVKIVCSLSALP